MTVWIDIDRLNCNFSIRTIAGVGFAFHAKIYTDLLLFWGKWPNYISIDRAFFVLYPLPCLVRCLDPNTCGGNLRVIWVAVLKRCFTCGVGSDGFPIRDPYPSSGSPLDGFPVKKGEKRQGKPQDHWAGHPTISTFRCLVR
jgi:hypothetical protein